MTPLSRRTHHIVTLDFFTQVFLNRHNVTVIHVMHVLYLMMSYCVVSCLPIDVMSEFVILLGFGKHKSSGPSSSGVLETNHDKPTPTPNANTRL
jgi:hypothetical protein